MLTVVGVTFKSSLVLSLCRLAALQVFLQHHFNFTLERFLFGNMWVDTVCMQDRYV